MDGHRLTVPGCQAVDGLVHGVRQSDLVVPRVQLHAAAVVPPQVRLHPVRQVRDHPAPVLQQAAVQAHAVVEQVGGVVVPPELQTVISHHHAVDDVQFSIDLPQMVYVVVVAHLPGHLLGGVLPENRCRWASMIFIPAVLLPVRPGIQRSGDFSTPLL